MTKKKYNHINEEAEKIISEIMDVLTNNNPSPSILFPSLIITFVRCVNFMMTTKEGKIMIANGALESFKEFIKEIEKEKDD